MELNVRILISLYFLVWLSTANSAEWSGGIELGGKGFFGIYLERTLADRRTLSSGFSESVNFISPLFGVEENVKVYYLTHAWFLGESHRLEFALGPAYVRRKVNYWSEDRCGFLVVCGKDRVETGLGVAGAFGYRYQARGGFFQFRTGLSPWMMVYDGNDDFDRALALIPYLSLGLHF